MYPQSEDPASGARAAPMAEQSPGQDLLAAAGIQGEQAEELGALIDALEMALRPQEPRAEFVDGLRRELLGERPSPMKRLRMMPARLHIAAALALVAGALFMLRRLFTSDAPQDMQEEAVATPL